MKQHSAIKTSASVWAGDWAEDRMKLSTAHHLCQRETGREGMAIRKDSSRVNCTVQPRRHCWRASVSAMQSRAGRESRQIEPGLVSILLSCVRPGSLAPGPFSRLCALATLLCDGRERAVLCRQQRARDKAISCDEEMAKRAQTLR